MSFQKKPYFDHDWDVMLYDMCHMIMDPKKPCGICRDPADDKFIDCAIGSRAEYLISGDKDLLSIQNVLGFSIFTPRQFLNTLKS